jgi:hypothetical protein
MVKKIAVLPLLMIAPATAGEIFWKSFFSCCGGSGAFYSLP